MAVQSRVENPALFTAVSATWCRETKTLGPRRTRRAQRSEPQASPKEQRQEITSGPSKTVPSAGSAGVAFASISVRPLRGPAARSPPRGPGAATEEGAACHLCPRGHSPRGRALSPPSSQGGAAAWWGGGCPRKGSWWGSSKIPRFSTAEGAAGETTLSGEEAPGTAPPHSS